MAAQLFTNNAFSVLNGAITDVATTINLTAGHGARFPALSGGDWFLLTIVGLDGDGREDQWEIVKVTARATDVLTVVRAQEGTTAVAWDSGTGVELRSTAGTLNALELAAATNAATAKATAVDADKVGYWDSVSGLIRSMTWANIKATLSVVFARLDTEDQTLAGGAIVTSKSLSAGSITIDPGDRPLQYITNNGAFTITAPANDGSCLLLLTNGASAGTVTFSGFTVSSSTGDSLTTTNTNKFTVSIWRINGVSGYNITAHQ